MIIVYKQDTKEIVSFESNTMKPALPANMTVEEQKIYYKGLGENFVCIPYEMGLYINDFKLCFDINENFVGLQPK